MGSNKEVYSCHVHRGEAIYCKCSPDSSTLAGRGALFMHKLLCFSCVYSRPEKPDGPENRRSYTSGCTPSLPLDKNNSHFRVTCFLVRDKQVTSSTSGSAGFFHCRHIPMKNRKRRCFVCSVFRALNCRGQNAGLRPDIIHYSTLLFPPPAKCKWHLALSCSGGLAFLLCGEKRQSRHHSGFKAPA